MPAGPIPPLGLNLQSIASAPNLTSFQLCCGDIKFVGLRSVKTGAHTPGTKLFMELEAQQTRDYVGFGAEVETELKRIGFSISSDEPPYNDMEEYYWIASNAAQREESQNVEAWDDEDGEEF